MPTAWATLWSFLGCRLFCYFKHRSSITLFIWMDERISYRCPFFRGKRIHMGTYKTVILPVVCLHDLWIQKNRQQILTLGINIRVINMKTSLSFFIPVLVLIISSCTDKTDYAIPTMGDYSIYEVEIGELSGICFNKERTGFLACGDKGIIKSVSFACFRLSRLQILTTVP